MCNTGSPRYSSVFWVFLLYPNIGKSYANKLVKLNEQEYTSCLLSTVSYGGQAHLPSISLCGSGKANLSYILLYLPCHMLLMSLVFLWTEVTLLFVAPCLLKFRICRSPHKSVLSTPMPTSLLLAAFLPSRLIKQAPLLHQMLPSALYLLRYKSGHGK